MTAQPVIHCRDVTKTYHGDLFKKDSIALRGVSLDVQPGEVFGIIGRNGAGKSTTIKILMGFIRHDGGTITLSGKSPRDPSCHRQLGYLPESPCLYHNLTILDHLEFAAATAHISKNETKKRIDLILHLVGLEHAADIKIKKYSKGMTQRAALACALIHDPEILILDEPMSGLDPFGRRMVVDIIGDCRRRKKTVLFSSHILTDVERICDRIGIMNQGRMLKIITPHEIPTAGSDTLQSPLEMMFMECVKADSRGI